MKLHIPKDWLHGVEAKDQVEPLAGPAPDMTAVQSKLAFAEKMLSGLSAYRKHMIARSWIDESAEDADDLFQEQAIGLLSRFPQRSPALLRGSVAADSGERVSDPRLAAWLAYLNTQSLVAKTDVAYEGLDPSALKDVVRFSAQSDGPRRAVDFLRARGVLVFIVRAIPGTRVDGCAFWSSAERPVIGLSARFDRLDNFWFSLLHECAHVALHVRGPQDAFADDLESTNSSDELEIEANQAAADAAIPRAVWKRSNACRWPTRANVEELAKQVGIHASIVAGRVRFERRDYSLFSPLLGHGEISKLFELDSESS